MFASLVARLFQHLEQTYQYHFISTLPIASVVEIEPVHVRIVLFGFRDILTVSYYEGALRKKNIVACGQVRGSMRVYHSETHREPLRNTAATFGNTFWDPSEHKKKVRKQKNIFIKKMKILCFFSSSTLAPGNQEFLGSLPPQGQEINHFRPPPHPCQEINHFLATALPRAMRMFFCFKNQFQTLLLDVKKNNNNAFSN